MMKQYFWRRLCGAALVGMLTIESCVPVQAAEQQTVAIEEEYEEPQSDSKTLAEVEEAETPQVPEGQAETGDKEEQSKETKSEESASQPETSQEHTTEEKSTVEESSQEESQEKDSQEESSQEESTEKESTSEESSDEKTVEEEETTEEMTEETDTEEETTQEETSMAEELATVFSARTTAPIAPTGFSVVSVTSRSVVLIWNAESEDVEYRVYRSTQKDAEYGLIGKVQTSSAMAAYCDSSCESGQTYYYKVQGAYVEAGDKELTGPFSDTVCSKAEIESFVLNKSELSLAKGEEATLKATYIPSYAAVGSEVQWSSSNESVATVVNGRVYAVGTGTARITAQTEDRKAYCTVTVEIPIQSVGLDKQEIDMTKGKTESLTLSILPEDTTDSTQVKWTSSNEEAVIVSSAGSKEAVLRAVGAGEAVITAQVGERKAECHVSVTIPATKITLSDSSIELLADDTEGQDSIQVAVTVLPADTTDTEITWDAEDDTLVDCSIDGNILTFTSKGTEGKTDYTIKAGSKTATLSVSVVDEKEDNDTDVRLIPVTDVTIQSDYVRDEAETDEDDGIIILYMGAGQKSKVNLSAKVSPNNATNPGIEWISRNTSVAEVTQEGAVTATGVGRTTITAKADNGVSDQVTIVVKPTEGEFEISSKKTVTLYCNEELPVADRVVNTHQITPSNDDLAYEYRSSNTEVATVNNDGLVTGLKPGTATITVLDKSSGNCQTMAVTVKKIAQDVKVAVEEMTVVKGSTAEIFFTVVPQDISKDCLKTLKFETGKNSPITILDNWTKDKTSGSVKFRADYAGEAQLTITCGDTDANGKTIKSVDKIITIHVVENKKKAASVKLSGTSTMKSGTTQTLKATVTDSSSSPLHISANLIGYTSSNESVATVDNSGTITAIKGGKAVITAYVMDGSNCRTTFTVNVEQRPENITFDREVYGISKAANASANITLKPIFAPSNVAANCKGLNWAVTKVYDADGLVVENPADYFVVNTSGVVTAKKTATEGMQAIIRCTSKAFTEDEAGLSAETTVQVQTKKVSAVKFTNTNVQAVGLTEHELAFTTTFAKGYDKAVYTASSSDTSIAEVISPVENGVVKLQAHKYGTVTITLCADHMVTATCKVTIYPFERGTITAVSGNYLIQQAQYDGNDKAALKFVDSKTKKKVVDPKLLTYTSSNPDVVYVDENGIAYANPKANNKITSKNNQVTITATLKDDPDKRKATTKVTVCTAEQIERMTVAYYKDIDSAKADLKNTAGKTLTDNGLNFEFKSSQSFVLRVTAYGVDNEPISNSSLSFVSSDKNIAVVGSATRKTNDTSVWEAVINVKRSGRFAITVSAGDQKKYSRTIAFGALSGSPILVSANLGTVNKNYPEFTYEEKACVAGSAPFTLLPADGTEIRSVTVSSAKIKIKNQIKAIEGNVSVESLGNNQYRLIMEKNCLNNAVDGTYDITLQVMRSTLKNGEDGINQGSSVPTSVKTTYKVESTIPKIKSMTVTLNSFIKGESVKIPFDTKETIEDVTIDPDMEMYNWFDKPYKDGQNWYIKLKEDKFDKWKACTTSCDLLIKIKGYDEKIRTNLKIVTKDIKPVVKQLSVPTAQLDHSQYIATTLVDNTNKAWTDYTITCKDEPAKRDFEVAAQTDGRTKIIFNDVDNKKKKQGITYSEKVLVKKEEWRSPIEVTLQAKTYSGTSVPSVKFDKSTVYMNRNVNETNAQTGVIVSMGNVELTQGEWKILDTCKYTVKENGKNVSHLCSEAFTTTYENGKLKVELKNPDTMPNGTYKLIMTNLWKPEYDEGLKQPLRTAELSVVVRNVAPAVTIKMSGKIDLVNRNNSTLQGTVTVANVNSTINTIRLINHNNDGFANNFYCSKKGNTFKIYARSNAKLTTKAVKGYVQITMSDGTRLEKEITFTPTQTTPKVTTPANQKVYKASSTHTVDFDFNKDLTKGIAISQIKAKSVPDGITVEHSNGHLLATLANKTLKPGKYKIVVNVYFKGAQEVSGNSLGAPVEKTVYVEVSE